MTVFSGHIGHNSESIVYWRSPDFPFAFLLLFPDIRDKGEKVFRL